MKRILISISFCLLSAGMICFGATEQEMTQARAHAARLYLRYSNNGAGYLDNVQAASVDDLEKKLNNTTDRNNLSTFKKAQVPTDYSGWDAKRLAEYWSKDIFSGAAALPDPKEGKDMMKNAIRKKIAAMSVTVTSSSSGNTTPTPIAANASQPVSVADESTISSENTAQESSNPIVQISESIDTVVTTTEPQTAPATRRGTDTKTWVFVILLIAILGVAGWLIYYASKVMKNSGKDDEDDGDDSASASQALFKAEAENARLRKEVVKMRAEIEELQRELEKATAAKPERQVESAPTNTTANSPHVSASERTQEESRKPAVSIENLKTSMRNPEYDASTEQISAEKKIPERTIYLGRVNQSGIFVRADKAYNPSATLFRLVTTDGYSGSFYFMNEPEAVALAFTNPVRMLENSCIVDNIRAIDGHSEIETMSAGTAVFESGCWKVIRKAKILYV